MAPGGVKLDKKIGVLLDCLFEVAIGELQDVIFLQVALANNEKRDESQ